MISVVRLAACAALAFAPLFATDEAGACSCVGPSTTLLTPDHAEAAPLNARVRVSHAGGRGRLVVRVHETGQEVVTRAQSSPYGQMEIVEITPVAPLSPRTRYEVALVETDSSPPVRVFGTFATGDATDATPPRLDKVGVVKAERAAGKAYGSCQATGPWVTVGGLGYSDPGRADAQLAMAVWLSDASGQIDETKQPAAIAALRGDSLVLGRRSICDPHDVRFPAAATFWLGLAVVDEAGQRSALRRVRVDLPAVRP